MKNSEYWQERFKQLEEAQNEIASNSRAEIERQYRQAVKEIEGKIDTWYRKLGANGISMAEASKPLSDSELADFKWDVYDYIKYGEENALSGQWIKQLENISNQLYISKYDELRVHTQQSIESLFAKQYGITTETMKKVYQSGYYHTAFEIQKGFGVGWDISGIDQNQLENVIAKPWVADGKNFSERIWINKQGLIDDMDEQLTQHIIRGDNPQRAIDAIVNNMNVYKSNAGRIVMTEGAYFGSAAQRECFEELGVEKYEIIATLDKHTSEMCKNFDGKVFDIQDYKVGVTAPPFHPWCRSTTCPCFDEGFGERTGSCRISEDISYTDWKERFVEGGDRMVFAAVDNSQQMAGTSNDWSGADPTKHTDAELEELNRYAEERGITLYHRQRFDGDISLMKDEIDTIEKIRSDFNHTDALQLGWKAMDVDDFGETSSNHQQIWINKLALRSRDITEKNLAVDDWLAINTAEGIVAHEMGHVISSKLKKGVTGLDVYKQTVYNVSGKMVSDDEALDLLFNKVSQYSVSKELKQNGKILYDEIISEILSVHYTQPNKYSCEFVKLLKEACKK